MAHALAQTVQQFVVARIVLAAGESVSTPAGLKAAAVFMPPRERNIAIGLVNAAPNIGAIITPLLIPPFALAFGWQAAFFVTGSLGFLWLIAWIAGTRRLAPVGNVPERTRVNWGVLLGRSADLGGDRRQGADRLRVVVRAVLDARLLQPRIRHGPGASGLADRDHLHAGGIGRGDIGRAVPDPAIARA